jgi:hypothetical protein
MAEESDGEPMERPNRKEMMEWLLAFHKDNIYRARKGGKRRPIQSRSTHYTLEHHVQNHLRRGLPHTYEVFKKRKKLKTGDGRFVKSMKRTAANRMVIHAL